MARLHPHDAGRQQVGDSIGDPDLHDAVAAALHVIEFLEEFAGDIEALVSEAQHESADFGRLHVARQPFEQFSAQHVFDVFEDLGRRRLGDVQLLRGDMHVAAAREGIEKMQVAIAQAAAQGLDRKGRVRHDGKLRLFCNGDISADNWRDRADLTRSIKPSFPAMERRVRVLPESGA